MTVISAGHEIHRYRVGRRRSAALSVIIKYTCIIYVPYVHARGADPTVHAMVQCDLIGCEYRTRMTGYLSAEFAPDPEHTRDATTTTTTTMYTHVKDIVSSRTNNTPAAAALRSLGRTHARPRSPFPVGIQNYNIIRDAGRPVHYLRLWPFVFRPTTDEREL